MRYVPAVISLFISLVPINSKSIRPGLIYQWPDWLLFQQQKSIAPLGRSPRIPPEADKKDVNPAMAGLHNRGIYPIS